MGVLTLVCLFPSPGSKEAAPSIEVRTPAVFVGALGDWVWGGKSLGETLCLAFSPFSTEPRNLGGNHRE